MAPPDNENGTEFLNVDLEVFSRESLAPFVKGLGRSVHVLHEGRWSRGFAACVELWASGCGQSAEAIIGRMVRLLSKMPREAKLLWNGAQVRQFNVGIQAASKPQSFELRLRQETLKAVATLGARLVVTVYAAGAQAAVPEAPKGRKPRRRTRGAADGPAQGVRRTTSPRRAS